MKKIPTYSGTLRSHLLAVPHCISECSGIRIFGRRIKSLVFTTDVAIIKNATLDYLKPAKSDLVVDLSMTEEEAKARVAYVEEHGKGQYPMDIPVKDANGELCANVHITYYLMPNKA